MADNIGWVSIYRKIQEHWIWKDPIKFQWWIDILLTVNNSDAKVNIGFEIFDCKRGQSLMSLQSWGQRWGVSKDTARNFLKLLEKDKMITCVSVGKSTRITVCNYDDYQTVLHVKKTTSKRQPNDEQTPPHPNNNEYNDYNENKSVLEVAFNDFLEMRKKIKKPVTERAVELLKTKLWKLAEKNKETALKIINQSIVNSWQDFYALKQDQPKNQQQYVPVQPINHDDRP